MKNILDKDDLLKPFKMGEIVQGEIIGIGSSSVYVDLGNRGTGIIYGREFYGGRDILKAAEIGDKILTKIIEIENENGYVELSVSAAGKEIAWVKLRQKKQDRQSVVVKILGANKGGLLAELFGISAFLPVSQLSVENYPRIVGADSVKILKALQGLVGKELTVQVFDIDQVKGKLILSEKVGDIERIKEVLKNYKIGDIVMGEITGIVDFGAFVKFSKENLKPLEGLIHVSELDWQIVQNPSDVIKSGQKIKAKIIEIDNNRVFLSLKVLKKNPWEDINKKYKKTDIVKGKVVKLNSFGAFVKLSSKIQGLCHVSEFDSQKKMEESLQIDKNYNFQIISIEPTEHKILLKALNHSD